MPPNLRISPPERFEAFSPSELFRFFFQLGHWTEESFSSELQTHARGKTVSTVTISKWKNKNVIPTHYTAAIFKLIEDQFENQVATEWITAFETVWAFHAARQNSSSIAGETLSQERAASDKIREKHLSWIKSKYTDPILGETFSTAALYVPLQMWEEGHDAYVLYDPEDLKLYAKQEWETNTKIDWVFVSGGPGCGKSMTALHLAWSLSAPEVFPIYARVTQLSHVEISLSETSATLGDQVSLASYLKHFRSSSSKTCCLILDGLDEIGGTASQSMSKLKELISYLKAEQLTCASNGKTLKIIAFGRSATTSLLTTLLPTQQVKRLRMVGLDGQISQGQTDQVLSLGHDFREIWWHKYLAAKGLSTTIETPEFLSADYNDFLDFGTVPLLAYLLCRAAFPIGEAAQQKLPGNEVIDKITFAENKNVIYERIIEQVGQGHIWRTPSLKNTPLHKHNFRKLLQHIALADWQNGGQGPVPVDNIKNAMPCEQDRDNLRSLLLSSAPSARGSRNTISTIFYYNNHSGSEEDTLKFSHNSFSNYLIATLILDNFVSLIDAFTKEGDIQTAIAIWMKMSNAKFQDPNLADFCESEAKLRYDALTDLDWDAALKLLKAPIFRHWGNDAEPGNIKEEISHLRFASMLIFLVWNCFNRERYRREGLKFQLTHSEESFSFSDLGQIHSPRFSSDTEEKRQGAAAENPNFLGHALASLNITAADMSHTALNTGHIHKTLFQDTSFRMNDWRYVRIQGSTFKTSNFQHASFFMSDISKSAYENCLFQWSRLDKVKFSHTHFSASHFLQCHLSEVDFRTCSFDNMIFDRCIFSTCHFGLDKRSKRGPIFRHCTFLDMSDAVRNIPKVLLKSCTHATEPNTALDLARQMDA